MSNFNSLKEKKVQILNLIPLSVPLFSAYIQTRCTDDEIDILDNDEEFQRDVQFLQEQESSRLIRVYKETAEKAASIKLDYNGIRNILKDFYNLNDRSGEDNNDKPASVIVNIPSNGR